MAVYIKSMGDKSFNGKRVVQFGCDTAADALAVSAAAGTVLYDGTLGPAPAPGSTKEVAGGQRHELNASGSWIPVPTLATLCAALAPEDG